MVRQKNSNVVFYKYIKAKHPLKIRPGVHELISNINNKQTDRQADTTSLYIIFVQYAIHCNTSLKPQL